MKTAFAFLGIMILMASCTSSGSFINHTLTIEKIGACTGQAPQFSMSSNTSGERYEFNYCLNDNYNTDSASMERIGDTLILNFNDKENSTKALYKLTLDVDANPGYHFIKLGGQVLTVVTSSNPY
jgi:hypothetical protein